MEAGADLVLTAEMTTVLAILGLTVALFVLELVRVDVAALLIMVILGVLGLVPSDRLFDGFASNAVISIIAVMILGAGLDRTGVMGRVAAFILKIGGRTETRILPLVSGTVGSISGLMQNVGATALFLPVVSRISSRSEIPLSKLLMPMGFCAIMGGTMTMVGSSPLILLNDMLANANRTLPAGAETLENFGLFSVTPIGLALLAAGIIYFLILGRWLLPREQKKESAVPGRTKSYFADVYGVEGDVYELLVTADSPLVGSTIGEAEAETDAPFVLALSHSDDAHLAPGADEMIWVGSVLGVMGVRAQVQAYASDKALRIQPRLRNFGNLLNATRAGISEAVIAPGSNLIGKTLAESQLRRKYGISVLAVNRGDAIHREDVREVPLSVGDSLVIHSFWKDLASVAEDRNFVVVTDFPKEEQRPHKVGFALIFFTLALSLIIFTDLKLSIALLVGAVGMILTGVLSIDEAYASVSWKTVFLLASLIPLGYAMEATGTAAWIAQEALVLLGEVSPLVLQGVLALLATFFSLVMSNVAATVLLVPLAINIALAAEADPSVFALTVALATSNAFLIPTHQVNALIMGPGGYRVADFLRAGSLMTLVFLVVMLTMVNVVFG